MNTFNFDQALARAARLEARAPGGDGVKILRLALTRELPGRLAAVSSFGAESAVLLHLIANIDPATPVIFLNTGQLFPHTLQYQLELTERLGLTDVRVIRPDEDERRAMDSSNDLWRRDADACCNLRKVRPLERALAGFNGWISGRKRFHGGERAALPPVEVERDRLKLNPLADWSQAEVDAYFERYCLPRHPLFELGFLSIGCGPCTVPAASGDDPRAGRWVNLGKTECGIHGKY
jgi:phosphoadenosine phosphosulfate reductase